MPVFMMTSVNTIYDVITQDTQPNDQMGTPLVDTSFHGLTHMALLNGTSLNELIIEASFQQQQKYLQDAALAATHCFNPVKTTDLRFRATIKLSPIIGELQPFDLESDSSGLAYALSTALTWGNKKKLFSQEVPSLPIFATGCVTVDGHIKPVGHIVKKINYTCRYAEEHLASHISPDKHPKFYIVIPSSNIDEINSQSDLITKIESLGGELIGIKYLSEALQKIMHDGFDGGIYTQNDQGFVGLNPISYEKRHLFMGREQLIEELYQKSLTALTQMTPLNVTGISGSGKSSAVLAGLVPKLLMSTDISINSNWIAIKPRQFNSIELLLTKLLTSLTNNDQTVEEWLNLFKTPELMAQNIHRDISNGQAAKTVANTSSTTLWIFDQFEEFFSLSLYSPQDTQRLLELLGYLAKECRLLIITILRTEYLSLLGHYLSNDVVLPRQLQPDEIDQIISLQLKYHRLSTQSAQADNHKPERQQHLQTRIRNAAIGKPLSSISYLLEQMYQTMITENSANTCLTHHHYEAIGGIDGVMAAQAETALEQGLQSLSEDKKTALINSFFEAFIGIDHDLHAVARSISINEIENYPEGFNRLVQAFMSKGLIIDDERGKTSKLKLVHDILLPLPTHLHNIEQASQWQRSQHWFNKTQNFLKWRRDIEPIFYKWQKNAEGLNNKNPHYIVDSNKLRTAHHIQKTYNIQDQSLVQYIKSSKYHFIKKRLTPIAIAATLVIALGIGLWHQFFREHTSYTAFIGERYGIPYGITPLTKTQRRLKQFHYQLHYKGKRLLNLSKHNSQGQLRNDSDRNNAALWKFSYTENGDLLSSNSFAQNGKAIISKHYQFSADKTTVLVQFKHHSDKNTIGSLIYQASVYEGISKQKTQITQHRLTFENNGFIQKREFFNNNEQPAKDASGAYGIEYQYHNNGLISKLKYIDIDGQNIAINGVYSRTYLRDTYGNIIEKQWLDKNNKPTNNKNGYSSIKTRFDPYGNLTHQHFFDDNQQITYHKHGFSGASARYDEHGNQIEQLFLNKDDKPTSHQWGFSQTKIKYDQQGNQIQWQYYDNQGKPTLRNGYFHKITFAYDDFGNRVEEKYFDTNHQPKNHKNGYWRLKTRYDTKGNLLEEAYFDKNDNPTLHKNGYARIRYTYNENDYQIQRAYFGLNDEKVINHLGYAYYTSRFDREGNRTEVSFYGTDNKLRINRFGFARIASTYNELGNKTDTTYYDTQGKLTLHTDSVARIVIDYDNRGNITQVSYYDQHNLPTLLKNSYATIKLKYDERNNRIREEYYDVDNNAILQLNNYASKLMRYDKRDNLIGWKFLDTKGKLINSKHGYAQIKRRYDEKDQLTLSEYFDQNEALIKTVP